MSGWPLIIFRGPRLARAIRYDPIFGPVIGGYHRRRQHVEQVVSLPGDDKPNQPQRPIKVVRRSLWINPLLARSVRKRTRRKRYLPAFLVVLHHLRGAPENTADEIAHPHQPPPACAGPWLLTGLQNWVFLLRFQPTDCFFRLNAGPRQLDRVPPC